jgi:hypothetical protein
MPEPVLARLVADKTSWLIGFADKRHVKMSDWGAEKICVSKKRAKPGKKPLPKKQISMLKIKVSSDRPQGRV